MELKMTQGKPLSIIARFVLPILLGFLFQQLYNMVDTVIVGRYIGPGALAAVGSTGTIMFMIMGIANGLTTGYTVLTSQCFGADNPEGTRKAFVNSIILALISTSIITVLSVSLMKPLLRLMNTPADIFDDAYAYITTICLGSLALIFYNLFAASLRAIGNSKTPLYFLIFSAFLNIILDVFFITVLNLGTMGAALATDVSQGVSAILSIIYIYRKVEILRPRRKDWRLDGDFSAKQLNIGIPMALQFGITASGTMVMQAAINIYESVAVAGFTAAGKVINLMTAGMPSIGQAIAAYSGQNYGKGDLVRVHQGTKAAMLLASVYSIVNAFLTAGLLPIIIRLFFDKGVDLSLYMPYAKIYCYESVFCYIPLAMIFIYRNTMQGCGFGKTALLLGLMELLSRLVTAFLSIRLASYPLAVAGDAIAWLTTGILAWALYLGIRRGWKKKAML